MPLRLVEVFGPTVQGEGPTIGRRCAFVRLGRCNLDCGKGPGATWACDTPYTWDWTRFDPAKELRTVPVPDVIGQVERMGVDRIVVTGGEPMIQRGGLTTLCVEAAARGWAVEIETNGTQPAWSALADAVEAFNVSPKLSNSGVPEERRLDFHALHSLYATGKAWFKFVCATTEDVEEAYQVVEDADLPPGRVWIMPAGTEPRNLVDRWDLAEAAQVYWVNVTTRLHVLTWGDERGR